MLLNINFHKKHSETYKSGDQWSVASGWNNFELAQELDCLDFIGKPHILTWLVWHVLASPG